MLSTIETKVQGGTHFALKKVDKFDSHQVIPFIIY